MKKLNKAIGYNGEYLSKCFLKNLGYKILICNFSCRLGEIDIVAEKKSTIHFIEVKSRFSNLYGYPCSAVNNVKKERLLRVAQYYIMCHPDNMKNYCFDVMEIYFHYDCTEPTFNFFEDAYRF